MAAICLLNGIRYFLKASDGTVIEVTNPYTGEVIGTVPAARPEHVARAFEIASEVQATSFRRKDADAARGDVQERDFVGAFAIHRSNSASV